MRLTEHDEGAHPGALPAALPEGEHLLWRGQPSTWGLARQSFHVVGVSIYFLALALWRTASVAAEPGNGLGDGLQAASVLVLPFGAALGVLFLLAWGYARSTHYTLTTARLAIRSGLAVPVTTTIAFDLISGASVKRYGDGMVDLCFLVGGDERPSWAMLWPSVRPWHWRHPEPSFRCLAKGEAVVQRVQQALERSVAGGQVARIVPVSDRPEAAPLGANS